jgi:hypothetical protein
LLAEAMAKGQQQRNICDYTKAGLQADNEGLSEKIESVLLAMKQEEFLVQNMRQTEKIIQTSMENVFGYMQIADWTLFNDLTRSNLLLIAEKLNPAMKSLLDRDFKKMEKAKENLKETLLLMRKNFEKSEEYLNEAIKEDEAFTKTLMETYPDLKQLDDLKYPSADDNLGGKGPYSQVNPDILNTL